MISLIIAVLIVLLSSAICSGAEASLFSVSMVKVRQLANTDPNKGQALLDIRLNMSRPIAAIVVLNNIANIVGSVVVGGIASSALGNQWLGVFSGVLTFLVIIFSEIIPKTLGEKHSDKIALIVAKPILFIAKLMTPILWVIEKVTTPITGVSENGFTTNESEIKLLANIGGQEGVIEKLESNLINRVFELNNVTAKMIMTPRVSLTCLSGALTLEQVKQQLFDSEHSRLVVIGKSQDEVLGVALKDELLIALLEGKSNSLVSKFVQEPLIVEENTTAESLLSVFQNSRKHLGIITGEYNGVSGVVTLEDVIEILTGEIVDETDRTIDLQENARKKSKVVS